MNREKLDDFKDLFVNEKDRNNTIEQLRKETLPLILWGGGDIAFGVRKYLLEKNIKIEAVWVDDSEKSSLFEDIEILSLREIKEKYTQFNVILGHSHFDMGEKIQREESQINKVYYLVSVSYDQYENIPYTFVQKHYKDYYDTYKILEDDKSKESMVAYLNCRINNNIRYIQECIEHEQNFFNNDIFKIGNHEQYVDVGAYDGDTLKIFLAESDGFYDKVFALEPEEENFLKLETYVKNQGLKRIFLYQIGTWKKKDLLLFNDESEQRFSIADSSNSCKQIKVEAMDDLFREQKISFIKINFYQGVLETIEGAVDILKRDKPRLAISIGVDEWGIIRIPQYIKKIMPEYKIYLRFNSCIPARLILYAEVGGR